MAFGLKLFARYLLGVCFTSVHPLRKISKIFCVLVLKGMMVQKSYRALLLAFCWSTSSLFLYDKIPMKNGDTIGILAGLFFQVICQA